LHVFPTIGAKLVTETLAGDLRDVLAELVGAGASRQQCLHLRNDVLAVLGELRRWDVLPENIACKVQSPKAAKIDRREGAVLSDDELVRYLAWEHPQEKKRMAVLERQTMACCSWFFGCLRWGDIRALLWDVFETVWRHLRSRLGASQEDGAAAAARGAGGAAPHAT
jgi:hypothetical protein